MIKKQETFSLILWGTSMLILRVSFKMLCCLLLINVLRVLTQQYLHTDRQDLERLILFQDHTLQIIRTLKFKTLIGKIKEVLCLEHLNICFTKWKKYLEETVSFHSNFTALILKFTMKKSRIFWIHRLKHFELERIDKEVSS